MNYTDSTTAAMERAREEWKKLCQKSGNGNILSNLNNALVALRADHQVRDMFAYDEMLRAAIICHEIGDIASCHRMVRDVDEFMLQEWMQKIGFAHMSTETVHKAIAQRAEENSFHPVRDYLRRLTHDGVLRIGTWLAAYMGAELNPYTMHIGRMFMVQMVARIIEPGCKADHMLVLEGAQGIMKSSACRVLGGEYFSDSLPDVSNDKEASQHLSGKWVIEVAEMHAMNRAEATLLKSFITRTEERYRPVWKKNQTLEPRQCVFIGTTNQDGYLRDPTGGRRFWPVLCGVTGPIQISLLAEHRDMLLAEAVQAYRDGDQWWPDQQFENEFIKPEQKARYAGDIWEDKITAYIEGRTRVTVAEVAKDALLIVDQHMTPGTSQRIASILKESGWELRRTGKQRYYTQGAGS